MIPQLDCKLTLARPVERDMLQFICHYHASITISQNIIRLYKQLKDAAVLYFVHIQPLVLLV